MRIKIIPFILFCTFLVMLLVGCDTTVHHEHDLITLPAEPETCTADGKSEGTKCTTCGLIIEKPQTIPATGHVYAENWIVDRSPTIEKEGEKSRHCTVCGERTSITAIPRLIAPTAGLAYEWNEQQTAYVCVGMGDASNLTELRIPSTYNGTPVSTIGEGAFANNTTITSVIIPESVVTIEKNAFSGCLALNSIELPDTVTYIEDDAFFDTAYYQNQSMWENGALYIGNHLISVNASSVHGVYAIRPDTRCIGGRAFNNCASLTNIQIPEGIVSIGNSAFYGCSALREIILPDSLKIIGNGAFAYCTSITDFTLPSGVKQIKSNPLLGCTALARLSVAEQNPFFYSINHCLIETQTATLVSGCITSQIPNDGSIKSIGSAAFYESPILTDLILPDGIETIANSAFAKCSTLRSIRFPDSLTSIGRQAFLSCTGLTEIILPNRVKTLGEGAFCYCGNLTTISLPEGITGIEDNAFAYCINLRQLNLPDSLKTFGTDALTQCLQLEMEAYGNCMYIDNWVICTVNTGVTDISLKPTTRGIVYSAFFNCRDLTSVTLPTSVVFVGDRAFLGCQSLTGLAVPEGVTTIGEQAFAYCSNLQQLSLPSTLMSIESKALQECTSLTSLRYGGSLRAWEMIQKANDWNIGASSFFIDYQ